MKNRIRLYAIISIIAASAIATHAATPRNMRHHCANDTTEINELLRRGYDSGITNPNKLIAQYARWLLDKPYVAHTLEGEQEMLTINIDELDCTTFVETLYALARTTLDKRYSWRDYAHNLESIRYRGGEIKGYASRLHYISDWIIDNNHRGNLRETTHDMSGVKYNVKTINYMSKHRDLYPALADEDTFQAIRNVERGYTNHRFPFLKMEWTNMKKLVKDLQEGDIIGIVTKIEGLDIQHMGVVVMVNDEPYLLDASSAGKKVQIEKENLMEYMRHSKNAIGVRVFRMTE
ncbi:MAG: N-acetylmuramoyl-L-alanine amidase-like domain-containing protein [Muribaculaceae bacterium]